MTDSLYNVLLSEGVVGSEEVPKKKEAMADIEDRAAKDAEAIGAIKKKPKEEEPKDEEVKDEAPKPAPKPKKRAKKPVEEEEPDEEIEEPAKKKPKAPPKKTPPPKKPKKPVPPPSDDGDDEEEDLDEKPAKKKAPVAAKKPKAKPKPKDKDEDGETTRHSPGYSLLRVERDRIDRALVSLRAKNEHRVANSSAAGKKPPTTVCSILNDALIEFYEETQGKFMARFGRYLEDSAH